MYSKIFKLFFLLCFCLLWGISGCSSTQKSVNSASVVNVTTPVSIPYPAGAPVLKLYSDLPGMLRLIGDNSVAFVTGNFEIRDINYLPVASVNGNIVELTQKSMPDRLPGVDLANTWRLRAGDQIPFQMEITNLKAEGHWNFSGLPITRLLVTLGTVKNAFTINAPNPAEMVVAEFICGGGEFVFEGINNANCRLLNITGGGGNLVLRFSGMTPTETLRVNIKGGTGTINITLPADIPAVISVSGERDLIPGEGITRLGENEGRRSYQTIGHTNSLPLLYEIMVTGGTGNVYLDAVP